MFQDIGIRIQEKLINKLPLNPEFFIVNLSCIIISQTRANQDHRAQARGLVLPLSRY